MASMRNVEYITQAYDYLSGPQKARRDPNSTLRRQWDAAAQAADATYARLLSRLPSSKGGFFSGKDKSTGSQPVPGLLDYIQQVQDSSGDLAIRSYIAEVTKGKIRKDDRDLDELESRLDALVQASYKLLQGELYSAGETSSATGQGTLGATSGDGRTGRASASAIQPIAASREVTSGTSGIGYDTRYQQPARDTFLDTLRIQHSDLSRDLEATSRAVGDSRKQLDSVQARLDTAWNEFLTAKKAIESLETRLISLATGLSKLTNSIQRIPDQYVALERYQRESDRVRAAEESVASLNNTLANVRNERDTAAHEREQFRGHANGLREHVVQRIIQTLDMLPSMLDVSGGGRDQGHYKDRDTGSNPQAVAQKELVVTLLRLLEDDCAIKSFEVNPDEPFRDDRMHIVDYKKDAHGKHAEMTVAEMVTWGYIDLQSGSIYRKASVTVYD